METEIIILAALDPNNGIGLNGGFPWGHLKGDLPRVKAITMAVPEEYPNAQNVLVFGWKTMETLRRSPEDPIKPLPGRHNTVITRSATKTPPNGFEKYTSFVKLIQTYQGKTPNIFIMGGSMVYATALGLGIVKKMILTEVKQVFEADTFFPDFNKDDWIRKAIDETDEYVVAEYTLK